MDDFRIDCEIALQMVGKSNDYFKSIWQKFASGWDGAPCSEIACCISYLAGNINTVPKISNYAEGLYNGFKSAGQIGTVPVPGAFIFFGYGKTPDHTGRVTAVYPGGFQTVEGNINNQVVIRHYGNSDNYIFAFGYPRFSDYMNYFTQSAALDNSLEQGGINKNMNFWMQMDLKEKGFYDGDLDGIYGVYTREAVKKYQKSEGLQVDGVAGFYTMTKLLEI